MPRNPVAPDHQRETLVVIAAGLCALLALVAYLGTLDNPFVFDDFSEVVQNASIRDPLNLKALLLRFPSRPLTNLLYLAAYRATGLNPLAYHAISIMLHTMNVVLLFALVTALLRRPDTGGGVMATKGVAAAFTTAILFAVHPLMTEAVGYASSQSELLYSAFFLSSLLCFIRVLTTGSVKAGLLGGLFFMLGLISKETTAVLPVVLIACDWTLLGGGATERRARFRRVHAPLLVVVAVLGLARVWLYLAVEHPASQGLQWRSIGLELHVIFRYAALLVWPAAQTILQPVAVIESLRDARLVLAVGLLAATIALALKCRKREPLISFGIAWFFLLLLPSAALIVISNVGQPMAEHRAYLASAGLLMGAGALVARLWTSAPTTRRAVWVLGGLCVAVATLFGLTVVRNGVWDDPVLLWEEATRRAPGAWMAHYGLADALHASGDDEGAVVAWERVVALSPNNADAYPPLAETLIGLGRYDRARVVLEAGLDRAPTNLPMKQMLADLGVESASVGDREPRQ